MKDEDKAVLLCLAKVYQEHKKACKDLQEEYLKALNGKNRNVKFELEKMKDAEDMMVDISARTVADFVLKLEEELTC